MAGTAANYMAGSLGIGSTANLGVITLRLSKTITGGATSYGILNDGVIQSGVTSTAVYNTTNASTVAASFTLPTLIHYFANQGTFGAGSSVSLQVGYYVESTLIGATTNYGFQGAISAGTGRWNLFMNGTANNYIAGGLGIGSTSVGNGINLNMAKTMTGATTQWNIYNQSQIQSDVTTIAEYFRTNATTQAATFTIGSIVHYRAFQGSFGAGSTVTSQVGFFVSNNLTGAVNNQGFYGDIAAGANRWNLFMNGTANNFMAGSLGIGSTALTGYNLRIQKTLTGAVNSRSIWVDHPIASDVTGNVAIIGTSPQTQAATFTLSNLFHFYANSAPNGAGSTITNNYGFYADSNLIQGTNAYGFFGNIPSGTNRWNLYMAGTANNYMAGKLLIGTTTDNGQGTLQNTGSAFLGGLQVGGLTFSTSTTATTSTIFYYFNGGSGQTLTLPSTVGISSYFLIKNAGTADLTISRSGSTDTIMAPNGTSTSTTISLAAGSQAILVSNGAFVWIQIV
jgi:hypothetical protein